MITAPCVRHLFPLPFDRLKPGATHSIVKAFGCWQIQSTTRELRLFEANVVGAVSPGCRMPHFIVALYSDEAI